jgi:hypothetical protein
MGLEPTTFCMANARARSRPFAQTSYLQGFRLSERTRPNPSKRRTLPFLPRKRLVTREGDAQPSTAARKSTELGRCRPAPGAEPCALGQDRAR